MVVRHTVRMACLLESNTITAVLVNNTQQSASMKGPRPRNVCGKPVMTCPVMPAVGSVDTDESVQLAMEETCIPFARQTPIVSAACSLRWVRAVKNRILRSQN